MRILLLSISLACFYWFGCNSDKVIYSTTEHSQYFTSKTVKLDINNIDNQLNIDFTYFANPKFAYPIIGNDTLSWTQFHFDFYYKDKRIPLDSQFCEKALWGLRKDMATLSFAAQYRNIQYNDYNISLRIPLYAMYHLKRGDNEVILKIYQDYFYGKRDDKKDSTNYKVLKLKKSEISATVKIKLKMPPIYQSTINMERIEIKEPKGWDFSLINEGNSDLYWQMNFPTEYNIYFKSEYIKNSGIYETPDNVTFYHYNPNDQITFYLLDYDWFSHNDMVEKWTISLPEILNKRNENTYIYTSLAVKEFRVKVKTFGVIN